MQYFSFIIIIIVIMLLPQKEFLAFIESLPDFQFIPSNPDSMGGRFIYWKWWFGVAIASREEILLG